MIRFSHNHKNDYDKQIKCGADQIGCYSEAAMKRLYPDKPYKVVGAIKLSVGKIKKAEVEAEKQSKQSDRRIGELHMGSKIYDVFHPHGSSVFEKTHGYVCVGTDTFLLVKQTTLPFVIALSSMVAGIALCLVLIVLMLGREDGRFEVGTEHPLPPIDVNVETFDETETETDPEWGGGVGSETDDPYHPGGDGPKESDPTESDPIEIDPVESDPTESDPTESDPTESDPPVTSPTETDRETSSSETEASDGGSVSMIYTLNAGYASGGDKVNIYFKNPSRSDHDVVLEFYAVGTENERVLMARSVRIPAGTGLEIMTLEDSAPDLQPGSYRGLYRVLFYDTTTGERALITSEITDVVITVWE